MQKQTLSFDQLPAAICQMGLELIEIKRLLTEQPSNVILADDAKPVDVNTAANFLGISRQTVYQNIDKIPHKKRFGRLYFFIPELTEYVKAGEGMGA